MSPTSIRVWVPLACVLCVTGCDGGGGGGGAGGSGAGGSEAAGGSGGATNTSSTSSTTNASSLCEQVCAEGIEHGCVRGSEAHCVEDCQQAYRSNPDCAPQLDVLYACIRDARASSDCDVRTTCHDDLQAAWVCVAERW